MFRLKVLLTLAFATISIQSFAQPRMITSGELRCAIRSWFRPGLHFYAPAAMPNPPGWNQEDVRFITFARKTSENQIALYRMFRPDGGGHFYTTDANERNAVITSRGFKDEQHIGYVYAQKYDDLVPLHRWWKRENDRHFYSTSKAEGDQAGFIYEKIIGYVLPADKVAANDLSCEVSWLDQVASVPTNAAIGGTRPAIDIPGLFIKDAAQAVNLANATPLANANPFTMAMGNNLAVVTEGNNVSKMTGFDSSRSTQSVAPNLFGVLHIMTKDLKNSMRCLSGSQNLPTITPLAQSPSTPQMMPPCITNPKTSIWILRNTGKIHWLNPLTGDVSGCLSVALMPNTAPQIIKESCNTAAIWAPLPDDPDALVVVDRTMPAGLTVLNYIEQKGAGSLVFARPKPRGQNTGWALYPVPIKQIPIQN